MKVRDAMTRDVRMANPEETIRHAAQAMAQIDAGALPVSDSACLAVNRVAAVPPAVLPKLDPVAVVHPVLDRHVIAPLALGASERDRRSVAFFLRHVIPTR